MLPLSVSFTFYRLRQLFTETKKVAAELLVLPYYSCENVQSFAVLCILNSIEAPTNVLKSVQIFFRDRSSEFFVEQPLSLLKIGFVFLRTDFAGIQTSRLS